MEYAWFGIILISFLAYVLLDGYDLGAGVIALFERDKRVRHEIVEEVSNVWDGNETWLVMLGVSLWAGFPLAFGVLLPQLYLPAILMLFALIFRGFSIELISQRDGRVGERWYTAFGLGSLVAAFAQGFALGSLTSPVLFDGLDYRGSTFSAFSWFSVLMGVGVVALYVTLGYAYLRIHGVGTAAYARRGGNAVLITGVFAVASLALVGLTPAGIDLGSVTRIVCFGAFMVFAVLGLLLAYAGFRDTSGNEQARKLPMFGMVIAAVAVVLSYVACQAPQIAPGLTIEQASTSGGAYTFLLVGIGINLPLIAYYNWFAQRTLTRKARAAVLGKDVQSV